MNEQTTAVEQTELEKKIKLAGTVARAHDLFTYGIFSGAQCKDVIESQTFLKQLHEEMMTSINTEMPKADTVEEKQV